MDQRKLYRFLPIFLVLIFALCSCGRGEAEQKAQAKKTTKHQRASLGKPGAESAEVKDKKKAAAEALAEIEQLKIKHREQAGAKEQTSSPSDAPQPKAAEAQTDQLETLIAAQAAKTEAKTKSPEAAKVSGDAITAEEVKRQTDAAIKTARAYVKQKEAEYNARIEEQLNSFNQRIGALQAQAQEISNTAKAQINEEFRALDKEMELSQGQLGKLGDVNEARLAELSKSLQEMAAKAESILQKQ